MMRIKIFLLCVPLSVVLFTGCDNDFNPKSPDFKERIVVYAILNSEASTQIVRLQRSYDSRTSNPRDFIGSKEITSATVSME